MFLESQTPQALLTLLRLKKREMTYLLQEEVSILRRDFKYVYVGKLECDSLTTRFKDD